MVCVSFAGQRKGGKGGLKRSKETNLDNVDVVVARMNSHKKSVRQPWCGLPDEETVN